MPRDQTEDEIEFESQVNTIREWADGTVAVVIALYEPDTPVDQLDSRVREVRDLILERVVGNKDARIVLKFGDASIKQMYRRIVEATLRWCIEKTLK